MSDITYTEKENAKSRLFSALYDYFKAAEKDGLNDDDKVGEINDLFSDLGQDLELMTGEQYRNQ